MSLLLVVTLYLSGRVAASSNISTEAHVPTPQYGHYLTHAHNHITPVVAAVDSCVAPIGAHQHGAAARSISGQTRESKTRWPYFSRFFLLSWKGPKQLKLLDFFDNCFLHFQKFLKEKKQTVNCREVKISTVSRKCLNPIEIASQELVSAQYMAPA